MAANELSALVLFWDEFSDHFKNNRNVLGGFQNLAALAKSVPFYFVIVTHESSSLIGADQGSRLVLDRFGGSTEKVEIPDTIAFELIRDALKVKEAQKEIWHELRDDLADRMRTPLAAVRSYAWRSAPGGGEGVLEGILPIHPMAALLLKNISAYFASNQRSMLTSSRTTRAKTSTPSSGSLRTPARMNPTRWASTASGTSST